MSDTYDALERRRPGPDHDLLIRVDQKVTSIKEWVDKHDCTHQELKNHVTALEQWRWKWVGAIAVGVFLLSMIGSAVIKRWMG